MIYNYNPLDKENRASVAWLCLLTLVILFQIFEAPLPLALETKIQGHHL